LLQFPLVQDDWGIVHFFRFEPTLSALTQFFNPVGSVFYRPLAYVYCAAELHFFGLSPLGFHLPALILLMGTSFLVVSVAERLSGDSATGWGAGFLYATAATVHIDIQMWLVGIFDIGATLFALLSIYFFLRGRNIASAVAMALGLGFKEAAVTVPSVLVALWIFMPHQETAPSHSLRAAWKCFRFHAVVLLAYLAFKSQNVSLFTLPEDNLYAARILSSDLWQRILLYAGWIVESVTPLKSIFIFRPIPALVPAIFSMLAAIAYIAVARRKIMEKSFDAQKFRMGAFIGCWMLLTLVPPISLINHLIKYYLGIALPSLTLATMAVLTGTVRAFSGSNRLLISLIAIFVALNAADGAAHVWRKAHLGLKEGIHSSSLEGDNHLIRKASLVKLVQDQLLRYYPVLPRGAALVLENVDIVVLGDDAAPQVWYGDSTLQVSGASPVISANGDSATLLLPPKNHWDPAGPMRVVSRPLDEIFCVRRVEDSLEVVSRDDLRLRIRESGSGQESAGEPGGEAH
jgi:hypothetical protein